MDRVERNQLARGCARDEPWISVNKCYKLRGDFYSWAVQSARISKGMVELDEIVNPHFFGGVVGLSLPGGILYICPAPYMPAP